METPILIDQRYRVIRPLGSGLSGEVLAVEDSDGKKALKFLKRVQLNVSRDEALENFKSEFSILAELNHPGIARILDFGFDLKSEKYFFTTELIEGKDFFAALAGKPVEVIEELAVQILRALNYLHSRGIYHFDIKPQNILVEETGGKLKAKIIDFGLAGFSGPRKKVGTPAYMAPEVISGGSLDARTDLYSLGVVFYKCLANENPFVSKELRETLNRQRTLIPKAPSQVNPAVPKYWDQIVSRLLEKLPSDRYAQASAVIRDINFLANKNYEFETADTRLSYIPEKGNLVGRRKEMDIFKALFEMAFKQEGGHPSRLLAIEGRTGTGKTRLLSEFKYYSQLNDVRVDTWKTLHAENPKPPFCLMIDESDALNPNDVNHILQQYANERILIVWATDKAPSGWSRSETVRLENFTEHEVLEYLGMVTGLKAPPSKLVREIYGRTDGNPLFMTELLKSMLANNLLLDSSGHWASSTFEDIGINFEKIQVPNTLSGLLLADYARLGPDEQKILEWMAVFNRPVLLETLKALSGIDQPHAAILKLTKDDLIERTDREHHFFFSNVMMRTVLYSAMDSALRRKMHDAAADFLNGAPDREEFLLHRGNGSDDQAAIRALDSLAEIHVKGDRLAAAVAVMKDAWERAGGVPLEVQVEIETKLAEHLVAVNDFNGAITHFQNVKETFDSNPGFRDSLEKRVQIYAKLGNAYSKLNQHEKAMELFQAAVKWLQSVPRSLRHQVLIQNHLANALWKRGEIDRAEKMFRDNYRVWETQLDEEDKKKVDNNWLADILILKHEYGEALRQIERDLEFFEKTGNRSRTARFGYLKGDVHFRNFLAASGEEKFLNKELAIKSFDKALKIAKQIDARDLMLRIYNGFGNLHFHVKEYDDANRNYERALALARKFQDPQNLRTAAIIAMNMASVFKKQKSHRDAYAYLVYAINTWEAMEPKDSMAWLNLFGDYTQIAEVYIEMNNLTKAEEAVDRAERIMRENEDLKLYEFWIWYLRAPIYRKQGHRSLFREAFRKAEGLAKDNFEKEMLREFQATIQAEELEERPFSPAVAPLVFKPMKQEASATTVPELETILQINKFINSEHNPDHLLKMVLNFALELSGAESGLVLLLDSAGGLEVKASVNVQVDEELTNVSTSMARRAIESGEVIISEDAVSDARFDSSESIVLNELKSVVCLPLKSKNKVIGVLYLDNRYRTNAFKDVNISLLNAYGDQVGIALENARLIAGYRTLQGKLEGELKKTEGELEEAREMLKSEASAFLTRYSYSQIISKSKPMQEIFKMLDKITETNLSVYLQGASGTGKELIARAIHFNNPQRAERRFVAINCGAIPANLIESELFGHKAGSFTGATKDKKGLFEEAHGGTIFLDEIGELEPSLQVRLLRVLQEGEVQRVGEVTPVKVDTRVVCASHKVLEDMVKQSTFREDLYYRLCQIKVTLPPLAERKEDIPLLAEHFMEKFRKENKVKERLKVSPSLMKLFFHYPWPGNVRELENVVNVACALRSGNILDTASLPQNYGIAQAMKSPVSPLAATAGMPSALKASTIPVDERNFFDPGKTWDQYQAVIIAKCYKANDFKKAQTAAELGISQATLYNKVRDFNLEAKDNPLYADPFTCQKGQTLKSYLPKVFKAALQHAEGHPYAAIRQLGVSQGYFYKIIKQPV